MMAKFKFFIYYLTSDYTVRHRFSYHLIHESAVKIFALIDFTYCSDLLNKSFCFIRLIPEKYFCKIIDYFV